MYVCVHIYTFYIAPSICHLQTRGPFLKPQLDKEGREGTEPESQRNHVEPAGSFKSLETAEPCRRTPHGVAPMVTRATPRRSRSLLDGSVRIFSLKALASTFREEAARLQETQKSQGWLLEESALGCFDVERALHLGCHGLCVMWERESKRYVQVRALRGACQLKLGSCFWFLLGGP